MHLDSTGWSEYRGRAHDLSEMWGRRHSSCIHNGTMRRKARLKSKWYHVTWVETSRGQSDKCSRICHISHFKALNDPGYNMPSHHPR